jgi:hypothetical protein
VLAEELGTGEQEHGAMRRAYGRKHGKQTLAHSRETQTGGACGKSGAQLQAEQILGRALTHE